MKVDIEVLSFCLNFSYAERFERLVKLVENNLFALLDSIYVFCFVSNGAFEVVKNRQESTNSLLATIEQKLSLFLECTLAIVVKFCNCTQILVFVLLYFFLGCFKLLLYCEFRCLLF